MNHDSGQKPQSGKQLQKFGCSAVILSGGQNSRMGGQNKAFLKVGGRTILDRLLEGLRPIFSEILLVTRQPQLYADWSLRIVTDLFQERSSLTGIHAGLVHAGTDFVFVVPCDTPFLQPKVIRLLLNALETDVDVVLPMLGEYYQPLCAVYSKRCLPSIEAQLNSADYKIINFFHRVKVKTLSATQVKAVDPQLRSFFNVNTPAAHMASKDLIPEK